MRRAVADVMRSLRNADFPGSDEPVGHFEPMFLKECEDGRPVERAKSGIQRAHVEAGFLSQNLKA